LTSQPSNPVTIPATKAHRNFGELVRRAYSGKEHFIVEKDGLPVVAVISIAEYQELIKEREHREERIKRFTENVKALNEEAMRRGITEEQLMADFEKTREEVYQQFYGNDH
jgi:prevent-host-death family protein